jgi:SAM-dependent methyltransferase
MRPAPHASRAGLARRLRANWEERTAIHRGPRGYDLAPHRAGRGRLDAIAEAEIGDVTGLTILHLQCHVGQDSIAPVQAGAAQVTGVDVSPAAIAAARALAAGLRLDWLREHPRMASRQFAALVQDAKGMWTWPDAPWLPLGLSLRAVRP